MRYHGDQIDSGEASEPRSLDKERVFHTAGRLGDLVVEIANITVAAVFLYRRVKNLLRPQEGDKEVRGAGFP